MRNRGNFYLLSVIAVLALCGGCASRGVTSAEEYFSIGMAYYDMGQHSSTNASNREKYFQEAEKWLNRAKSIDKTKNASEYNLGRIAFEMGRYEDAAKCFESILKRDPANVLALKAAAYTRIKTGEIEKAEALYNKLLELVPESADDGYNHALVLLAMEKYAEAEQVLKNHEFALLENNDVLLLYARTQKEQGKIEAIDNYAKWLDNNTGATVPIVRYEYAQLLEKHELFARALDEYRTTHRDLASSSADPAKPEVRFAVARVLLIADGGNPEGLTELKGAVDDGFKDFDTIEELLADERVSAANKDGIRTIITDAKRAPDTAHSAVDTTDMNLGSITEEDTEEERVIEIEDAAAE